MANTIKEHLCTICGEYHPVDKYDWVESCIGYYDMMNIFLAEDKWREDNAK